MLLRFDHVNIRTANLDNMVAWYGDVLGLFPGLRPDFGFPGAWLYLGDLAVVHLVATQNQPQAGGDVTLEHAAFRATDMSGFLAKLKDRGIPYRLARLDDVQTVQVNIHDPDGNHLHIDFDLSELPDDA